MRSRRIKITEAQRGYLLKLLKESQSKSTIAALAFERAIEVLNSEEFDKVWDQSPELSKLATETRDKITDLVGMLADIGRVNRGKEPFNFQRKA